MADYIRFTYRGESGRAYFKPYVTDCGNCDFTVAKCREHQQVRAEALAAYEDSGLTPDRAAELGKADAEGRLVVLPCKVGTEVYLTRPEAQAALERMKQK